MLKFNSEYFNCSNQQEHDYIISLYEEQYKTILTFHLKKWCKEGVFINVKYEQVYDLIKYLLDIDKK